MSRRKKQSSRRPVRRGDRERPLEGAALRAELQKWDRALMARPGDFIARSLRALHLGTANRWHEALRDIDTAVRQIPHGHPAELELIALRSMVRREMGKLREALADLDLLAAVKVNALVLAARGEVRRRLGDPAGARSDLDRSLEMSPTDPFAYLSRGRVHFTEREIEAALLDFNAARKIEPDGIAAYHHLAWVYRDQGDTAAAQADWDRALHLARQKLARDPSDTRSRTWIAWISAEGTGTELDHALRLMEEVRERASDFEHRADFLETTGRVHYRLGHLEEAVRLCNQAEACCPDDVDVRRRVEEVRRSIPVEG